MPSELRKQKDLERTEKRRQALLDAASRVFVRQGYHRTLISDIVAEAGVGQGTFYRHFTDKRQILETLFDTLLQKVAEQFSEMESRPPETLTEFKQASVEAYRRMAIVLDKNRDLAGLLLREGRTIDPEFQRRIDDIFQGFHALAQGFLDHAVRHGFARQFRTDIVAHAIVGLVIGMAEAWWSGRVRDADLDALVNETVDFAFEGLIRPNGAGPN